MLRCIIDSFLETINEKDGDKAVFEVYALMFAPIASVSATMLNAVRRFVPLNIVCSIKCESPFVFGENLYPEISGRNIL